MSNKDRDTHSAANVESTVGNAPVAKKKDARPDSRYHIHVHSVRNRLCDPDGISAKAAIDGIVKAGILPDDSARYVKAVSYTQEKGAEEKTIITLEACNG